MVAQNCFVVYILYHYGELNKDEYYKYQSLKGKKRIQVKLL